MLIVCNGAIKSGSTWLYNILVQLVDLQRPPDRYLTANSRARQTNPCIRPDRLSEFLEAEDFRAVNYISKNHLGRPEYRDLLLGYEDVYVFDIERNIRDVVVSSYYDERNRNGLTGSFADYYWSSGRYVADEVTRYHEVWRNAGPRFCMIVYEKLHDDFGGEVSRVANVLGLQLDETRISAMREKTSLGTLRKQYKDQPLYEGDRFFRKGVVGDWQNHFDAAMTRDMESIEQHGIGPLDWRAVMKRAGRMLGRPRR